ncbi:helix-turn-helix domain-containing protein [Leptospira langatensis]|uniref:Helix-turn-helix domain-containing protein n=1 Tax=Leptospira langatensis TaxID=2484983 RepID=A0A5F1ZXF8_9LEPT|nr:helix-turn-helix domain-containing protein [Leptospira langatensis]TGJ98449.1 helix-turn-helix domain-containing protein [Leptospira langatensis]TGL43364.1 helix-turn-helix domain-containing protein [Leptospira langatensis]
MSRFKPKVPVLHLSDLSLAREEKIFYAGRLEDLPPSFTEYDSSHRHSYFAIFFFLKGKGTHSIDFQKFEIERNSLFFLKPGQVHSWTFHNKPEGFALKISPEFYSEISDRTGELRSFPFFSFSQSYPKIVLKPDPRLVSDFLRLSQEFEEGSEPKILFFLSQLILLQIKKEYEKFSDPLLTDNGPVSEFQILLEKHFIQERATSFYSRRLGLSPSALNRICQSVLGKSAKSIVHDRVLLEIKRLLLHSEMSITQICRELCFSDNAYLSRYFKVQTGLSPEQFRDLKRKAQ